MPSTEAKTNSRRVKTLRSIFFLLLALPLLAAQQTINTGTNPNDGVGDSLRTAFTKVNANFTDLYNTAVFSNSVVQWSSLTNTPATLAGYGITNGITAATAASTYAPIASPTFTGTVTIPSGASISGYLTTTNAASTYAPLASPTFTGTVTIPSGASISGFAPIASPALTGTPTVPTASVDTSTTQAASTAFVLGQAASATPLIDGTAAVGTSTRYARGDHVHPTDTSRAPLASPTFTGTVTIPTGASITSPTINTAANFASTATLNWNSDTYIQRDAANIVAQRNSTTAQGFRIYNTFSDVSNYERGVMDWTTTANTLTIGAKAAGTGTQRNVVFDGALHRFDIAGSAVAYVQSSGLTPTADGAKSLGQQTAFRWQYVYAKAGLQVTGAAGQVLIYNLDPGTSGGNNEYATLDWSTTANTLTIGTGKSGSGLSRAVNFVVGGVTALTLGTAGDVQLPKTITAAGTTGAQTINKASGSVNLAASATSLVVTDSLVSTSSVIICTVGSNDTTCKSVQAVAGSGSFTIYPNAAPTAETRVNFIITN